MRRVLPPVGSVSPHVTSAFGATDRPPGSTNPHRGVDFNYVGGKDAKLNKSHQALRSPVDGIVENAGQGSFGRIAIRDKNGFLHEILHTDTRHVAIGDPVSAGQLIGTMGNTGVDQKNPKDGAHHVHYQLKDTAGNVTNPIEFWDRQGPADPNPASPAYLEQYQQYLRGLNPNAARPAPPPASSDSFADRFTKWDSVPQGDGSSAAPDAPATFDNRFGSWGFAPAGGFDDTNSPVLRALQQNRRSAIPDGLAPPSAQAAPSALSFPPDGSGSGSVLGSHFDPGLISPARPVSPRRPAQSRPTALDLAAEETGVASDVPVRILSRRAANASPASASDAAVAVLPGRGDSLGDRFGMPSFAGSAARATNRPASSPARGIASGQPMPNYPVPASCQAAHLT